MATDFREADASSAPSPSSGRAGRRTARLGRPLEGVGETQQGRFAPGAAGERRAERIIGCLLAVEASGRIWGSKHALLLAGIGWGNMLEPMVHEDLAAGRLKWLDLPEWLGGFYAFHAIHRTDTPPGPAAAWMIRHFAQQAA
jgi:DNA-binding transcriptional LysR family regulator